MHNDRIAHLIFQYQLNELSGPEKAELDEWLSQSEKNRQLFEQITDVKLTNSFIQFREQMKQEISRSSIIAKTSYHAGWWRYAAAAAVVLMVALTFFLWNNNKGAKQELVTETPQHKNDVEPGKYKARLTLASGETIILDSAVLGELAKQGATTIINKNGQLVYDASDVTTREVIYNTLSTAKGETYITVLADGTKVWLNSGSSITYPVAFVGRERKVSIEGEAYFDVAENKALPFIAETNGMSVAVTGTEFNINSYEDEEAIKTTLVSGAVNIHNGNNTVSLIPGQQAFLKNNKVTITNDANINEAIAWKNNDFYFRNASLQSVMRQLARWYNINVIYEGSIPAEGFTGEISRTKTLAQVLKMLEITQVHFKIEGRQITVLP